MKMAIASGKGGTGKTTVAVNLALSLQNECNMQILDCDVEEPNAHLFLKPDIYKREEAGIPVPRVDFEECSFCGRCTEVCAFNALTVIKDNVLIFDELCHGCGGCAYFCPEKAIREVNRPIGIVEIGHAGRMLFCHGRLNPGEAMSPPLINAVKDTIESNRLVIIDAPPGTSCPVVTAVKGSDFCVLVTEPTPFGLNDLEIAYKMAEKLGIPAGVVINRCDIGDGRVEAYCQNEGLPVLLKLPFDRELARLYARGEPAAPSLPEWRRLFRDLYDKINEVVNGGDSP